jgi:ATP-dependent RNA helicase DeaD
MTTPTTAAAPDGAPGDLDGEVPPPLPTFDALPLSEELRATLNEIGYLHPTPVQLAVWEPVTRGRDAVVQARTGTGKTASFGLPIIDRIVRKSQSAVQVLVLVPTRELAVQVSAELGRLAAKKGTQILAVYGGAPMQRQIDAIANGTQIVVGTPGRVLDHIRRGTLPTSEVRLLVLDESDEMLSMGFERELTSILETLPPTRQTVLFSATLPPDIERMAKNKLKTPEFITLSGDAIGALSIAHFVYMVTGDKAGTLGRIIEVENPESAVVFCNTKDATEAVAQALTARGYDADWLNGDLPQSEREKVMSATREGRLRFLVATDVAARGIDISHLTHVINYDFPFDMETYVHRTGRTGRAGRTGTAISLISPQDIGGLYMLRLTYKIRPIERQIPTPGELKTRAEADMVMMLAEAFLAKGIHPDDRAMARRILSHDQAEGILAGLLRDHLGARPTAQDEASAARRTTPRRGMLKRREERWAEAAKRGDEQAIMRLEGPPADENLPPRRDDRRPPRPREDRPPREERPRDDRPRDDRPREDRPREDRPPREERPRDDRPRDDRPPREERPRDDRPREDRPPREERPREERPREDRPPREERPRDDRPREDRPPREERPRDDRPREDRPPREERPRADRPRDDRPPREDRPRDDRRPRDDASRAPVMAESVLMAPPPEAASPSSDVESAPRARRPRREGGARGVRHADYATWQPKAEEGDDEPLLAGPGAVPDATEPAVAELSAPIVDGAEIFVNVGRRDGVRASDLQKVLVEVVGLDRERVQRIRVRDRHSFVTVPQEDVAIVLEKIIGTTLGGRTVNAEPARERQGDAQLEPRPAESA